MSYCCSQCDFTTDFESALMMHHQLHHEAPDVEDYLDLKARAKEKAKTVPRGSSDLSPHRKEKHLGLASRTASATRLFGKLRAKICRSITLFPHPEEKDLPAPSECTSKALKDTTLSRMSTCLKDNTPERIRELYLCHLCSFEADRITALDRHLLNDHKIGIDNLLKLVMAKTQEGLTDYTSPTIFGIRQSYYRPSEYLEDGEFVIETVTPRIKILKHASTNTVIQWCDIPNLKDNCRMITKELDRLVKYPMEKTDKDQLLDKMQTLNECMCKFVDSSNTLKQVLTKEFDSVRGKERLGGEDKATFDLALGDQQSYRDRERANSEKLERSRSKYGDKSRFPIIHNIFSVCQRTTDREATFAEWLVETGCAEPSGRLWRALDDIYESDKSKMSAESFYY